MLSDVPRPSFWPEIRVLLLSAMAIFVFTIVIGILNGTDIVEFDRKRILGHVHGGTLGWLTLAVFAASLWLFGQEREVSREERRFVRVLSGAAIVSFALYIAAFSASYGWSRPILGIAATIVIVGFFGWVLVRARSIELGVPHWGFLAALGTSIVGGILGILLGLQIATGDQWLPDGGDDAHPATMVVGFLIPVTLAMAEWAFFFPRPPAATRRGIIQMVFPFLGGVILMISILLDITPLAPIAILLEIIGIAIFFVRMWPSIRGVEWQAATPGRYAVASAISVLFVIGLAQFFIIRHDGDFDLVPTNQMLALDHTQFIGAMTNAVFAMLLASTMPGGRGRRIDQVVFVLVNVGLVGFAMGLLFDVTAMKRIFAPIMGTGLLIALGVFAARLTTEDEPVREPGALPEPATNV